MPVGDFQNKSLPVVHKLFHYSGGKKRTLDKISDLVHMIWLVINDT